jgi:uncharacterized glyoxalase superfamily protein PhnB
MSKAVAYGYLFFGGRCEEALDYYKKHLSAEVGAIMRHTDSPEPAPEGMLPDGFESKVMHAEFTIGQTKLMASDGCGEVMTGSDGYRVALVVPTEADANRVYTALADGGKAEMPICKTFWSPAFGMVVDQFGIRWMVMVPGEESC